MIDFKTLKSLIINGQSVKTLSIDGRVVWSSTPVSNWKGLKFISQQDGSTIKMVKTGNPLPMHLEYSYNGFDWEQFVVGNEYQLQEKQVMYLRADDNGNPSGIGQSDYDYNKFEMTGLIAASGELMGIYDKNGDAKIVTEYGLRMLFENCNALTSAPDLSAEKIMRSGVAGLYRGCSRLTYSGFIDGEVVGSYAFHSTFTDCTSLNKIKIGYTGNFPSSTYSGVFTDWVKGVSSTGKFIYNGTSTTRGTSAIPDGWTIVSTYEGLSFKATQPNSTIAIKSVGSEAPVVSLQYSLDEEGENWVDYTIGSIIPIPNVGDTICFKAKTANASMGSNGGYNQFVMTGSFEVKGNINSLLDGENFESIIDISNKPYCFDSLFKGCSSLTNFPDLPAETLGSYCYTSMFANCTSLVSQPTIKATTLADHCYSYMFSGCTSLTSMSLTASTLAEGCYVGLFNGCSNLNVISLGYSGDFDSSYFNNWVDGVASEGTLYYKGSDTTRGVSAIPQNWVVEATIPYQGLKFTAQQDGSTLKLTRNGSAPTCSFQTSTNGAVWEDYTIGSTITLANVGDVVYMKAKTSNEKLGSATSSYYKFVMTGLIGASGDVDSLLNEDFESVKTIPDECYRYLFDGCSSLTTAPYIGAESIGRNGCICMFRNCTSLGGTPYIAATSLNTYQSLRQMFYGCSSLSSVKIDYIGNFGTGSNGCTYQWLYGVLPTGTLYYKGGDITYGPSAIPSGWTIVGSYEGLSFKSMEANSTIGIDAVGDAPTISMMYSLDEGENWNDYNIGNIITMPNVGSTINWKAKTPNTGLGSSSGYNHFVMTGSFEASGDINSLMNEDFESVSTLTPYCYSNLFNGCTSLLNAPELPTSLAQHCYDGMFIGCTSLTSMTLPSTTLSEGCYMNMFEGCTSLTSMTLPATTLAEGCYKNMLSGCTSLTSMSLTASTLAEGCYVGLFNGCSNLNDIYLNYTGNFDSEYFSNWVNGVADEGKLIYSGEDTTRGDSAIPLNWEVFSLPYARELASVENTGTSYITLPYDTLNVNDEIEIKVMINGQSGSIIGSNGYCNIAYSLSSFWYKMFNSSGKQMSITTGQWFSLGHNSLSTYILDDNGEKIAENKTFNSAIVTPEVTIFKQNGVADSNAKGKVKHIKLVRDGVTLIDAIPVMSNDGNAEMYNKADNTFLPRTGTLVANEL